MTYPAAVALPIAALAQAALVLACGAAWVLPVLAWTLAPFLPVVEVVIAQLC